MAKIKLGKSAASAKTTLEKVPPFHIIKILESPKNASYVNAMAGDVVINVDGVYCMHLSGLSLTLPHYTRCEIIGICKLQPVIHGDFE